MTGITTKKIMSVACIVNIMLYASGGMTPSVSRNSHDSGGGSGVSGQPSWWRISMARNPPMSSMNRPRNMNCRPIILWSVEKM